jgi:uncharacterized membrane protein
MKYIFVVLCLFSTVAFANKETALPKVRTSTEVPFEVVSFERSVKPIMQQRCNGCHNENSKVAPNITKYSVAKQYGSQIKAHVTSGRMPLRNLTNITDSERNIIRNWVNKGMRE